MFHEALLYQTEADKVGKQAADLFSAHVGKAAALSQGKGSMLLQNRQYLLFPLGISHDNFLFCAVVFPDVQVNRAGQNIFILDADVSPRMIFFIQCVNRLFLTFVYLYFKYILAFYVVNTCVELYLRATV